MEKVIKLEGFILRSPYGTYTHATCDMAEHGYIMVGPHNIEYTVPADFNPVAAEVAALNATLDKINDEHRDKVLQIKGRIQELQCIENNPTPASTDSDDAHFF